MSHGVRNRDDVYNFTHLGVVFSSYSYIVYRSRQLAYNIELNSYTEKLVP